MHRLLLAGLFGLWAATASAQQIKIGELGIVADAPFYIAIEKGYFAAEKLDVTLERFNSAAQATAPLIAAPVLRARARLPRRGAARRSARRAPCAR